jgi:hypothetical protein
MDGRGFAPFPAENPLMLLPDVPKTQFTVEATFDVKVTGALATDSHNV